MPHLIYGVEKRQTFPLSAIIRVYQTSATLETAHAASRFWGDDQPEIWEHRYPASWRIADPAPTAGSYAYRVLRCGPMQLHVDPSTAPTISDTPFYNAG